MKRIYLFLVFCCSFQTYIVVSETTVNKSYDSKREIELNGDFFVDKSSLLIKPIQVFIINEQFIDVVFNDTLGIINISIMYYETGTNVYQNSVNIIVGQHLLIDITSFDPGEYTIKFINSQKKYLSCNYML